MKLIPVSRDNIFRRDYVVNSIKKKILITSKSYPVLAWCYIFHNRNLTFTNENLVSSRNFFHLIVSSGRSGPKLMFTRMCETSIKGTFFWMKKHGCNSKLKKFYAEWRDVYWQDEVIYWKEQAWHAQHCLFNDTWNSHDETIFFSKIKKDIKKLFEYNVWIKKPHIIYLIKEV